MDAVITAKFVGGLADSHRLPAYEAAQSFYGLSRTLVIALSYLAEGKVRHRNFRRSDFSVDLVATTTGSFKAIFEVFAKPNALSLGSDTDEVSPKLVKAFISSVINTALGRAPEKEIEQLEQDGLLNPGDLLALADAILPALRSAHEPIGAGVEAIEIIAGKQKLIEFDRETKDYLRYSYDDPQPRTQLFSVASINANTGYGRVFDLEAGHTVPFQISSDLDAASLNVMMESLSIYTKRRWANSVERAAVAIKYTARLAKNGAVKRIFPIEVAKEISDLSTSQSPPASPRSRSRKAPRQSL